MKKSINQYRIYQGSGKLDDFQEIAATNDTAGYQPSPELVNAVNVAILLGKPLLVTGEPGTGKTLLGKSIADNLQIPCLEFTAKTTSKARDLLYRYDSIGHLRQANLARVEGEKITQSRGEMKDDDLDKNQRLTAEYKEFIQLNALGEAIQLAQDKKKRSVVLIDEIDKAPRDFPNDILREIENLAFTILETSEEFSAPKTHKPIIIITSNAERLLPDAFLRRCLFFHIDFPDKQLLKKIVTKRLSNYQENGKPKKLGFNEQQIDWLIQHFQQIRDWCRKKQPATAEFLSWLQVLDRFEFSPPSIQITTDKKTDSETQKNDSSTFFASLSSADKDLLLLSYSVLAKHEKDFEMLKNNLNNG